MECCISANKNRSIVLYPLFDGYRLTPSQLLDCISDEVGPAFFPGTQVAHDLDLDLFGCPIDEEWCPEEDLNLHYLSITST
jgi:hypothetical protein